MIRLLLTSGRGPVECRIALARTLPVLEKEAHEAGVDIDIASGVAPDDHGPGSAIVLLRGEGAAALANAWAGSIKWIFQSPRRPHHRRKNWFIGVVILPPTPEGPTKIDIQDITFDTFRAGGPGGQHQNNTDSAVRATHVPTGVSVVSRTERSQHQNKSEAVARLAILLQQADQLRVVTDRQNTQAAHDQLQRGKPVRTFKDIG